MASKSLPSSKAAHLKVLRMPTTTNRREKDDPEFIALRLKSFARLIYLAATSTVDQQPIDEATAAFITFELQAMADGLLGPGARGTTL